MTNGLPARRRSAAWAGGARTAAWTAAGSREERRLATLEWRTCDAFSTTGPDPALQSAASWQEAPAADGYATWAATYDDAGNPLIELDQATLGPLLERYPAGDVLDAACGTGRWAAFLNERGHTVIGVDESPQMLGRASVKVPRADFRLGDIQSLPVPTASVDVVVCSLALTHLTKLDGVLAEFARVLRPGGHAVISNIHHLSMPLGGTIEMVLTDGRRVRLPDGVSAIRLHQRSADGRVPNSGVCRSTVARSWWPAWWSDGASVVRRSGTSRLHWHARAPGRRAGEATCASGAVTTPSRVGVRAQPISDRSADGRLRRSHRCGERVCCRHRRALLWVTPGQASCSFWGRWRQACL